jgi:hypothetical protein
MCTSQRRDGMVMGPERRGVIEDYVGDKLGKNKISYEI